MIGVQPARGLALVALAALLGASPASSASETDSVLEVTGMTFVRSRDSASELVVRARHALFWPDSDVAKLEDVQAVVTDEDSGRRFEMTMVADTRPRGSGMSTRRACCTPTLPWSWSTTPAPFAVTDFDSWCRKATFACWGT
jgi:hypothetical protein